ncbi:triosephosphate isomerase [Mycobacterium manitobense]|uniref:Triosephosphate isomerase n=1 Tax=[Mycobacterium] manitobense TaxID=190147 RepID=A0A9X2YBA1_9MYCO|nr:triose-phosphate isomerase family protein [[Mycobacterium] manitobense]MCV7171397.1 triosephosphate isomerase [[Mycobacterium] manitobense]
MTAAAHRPATIGISLKMYMGYHQTTRWCERIAGIADEHPVLADGLARLFVLPSFPAIPRCVDIFAGRRVDVGAQDLFWEDAGAFTGEVSGSMLSEMGCAYAEIGHAERRRIFGESDRIVASKAVAALRNGLTPVVCVGEPKRTTAEQAARSCIRDVNVVVDAAAAASMPASMVVAYEPQWAIGAGEPAPVDHIQRVCRAISGWLAGEPTATGSRVVYGGSAGPGLLSRLGDAVDGLFLGRRAHDPAAVVSILDEVSARP